MRPRFLPLVLLCAGSCAPSPPQPGKLLLSNPDFGLINVEAVITANPDCAARDVGYISTLEFTMPNNGNGRSVYGATAIDLGDAGAILDATARAHYKHRLDDLREDIENGGRANNPGTTERARAEFDAISEQLLTATGLGGRGRRAASHRERARVVVTKRIKAAIGIIRASNPTLGQHLAHSISTGHFCRYAPAERTAWQF